jgi:hypothetical protein
LAWSNNQAPSPLNDYVVLDSFYVRTPGSSLNPATFNGKSLRVEAGGGIRWKRAGMITIDDLRLNGGALTHAAVGDDQIGRLAGNINVLATSSLNGPMSSTVNATNIATPRQIEIHSPMTNSGGITITTSKAAADMKHRGYIVYSTVAKDYLGDTVIEGKSSAGAGGLSDVGATLRVSLENALPHGPGRGNLIIQQDGTLNLGGFNTTVNGLSGAGWVANLLGTGNTRGSTPTGTAATPATLTVLGTLSPGESIGTLSFLQDAGLALDPGSMTVMDVNAQTLAHDLVVVGGDTTYAGTLEVNNVAGTLAAGQSFPLFSVSGSSTGNFSSISPATPGPNLAWEFNPSNGTLSVVSTAVAPPELQYAITPTNTFVVSWSGSGFHLQAQTNTVGVGLSTNWGDYPGGTASPVIVPINPANGSVFLRLVSP